MLRIVIKEIFYTLTSALIIFVIMEIIKPNIVQSYINMNFVLILWLIVAIILVVRHKLDDRRCNNKKIKT